MPAISTAITAAIGAAGVGASAFGLSKQMQGAKAANAASQQIQAIQQQQEDQRRKQMELDAIRRKREVVRSAIAARSMALTTATSQGANLGSALPGAYGGIAGSSNEAQLGISQNLTIGRNMFDLKSREAVSQAAYARAQATTGFGTGMMSLGQALVKNMEAFGRVGGMAAKGFGFDSQSGSLDTLSVNRSVAGTT